MKTNFFATIAPFLGSMNLTFTVAKGNGDTVIVSLLPQPRIKDNAKENVQPMVIRGTIEELDNEFFKAIQEPMTKVTGIVIEIDSFEKGAEKLAEENKAQAEIKAKKKKDKEKADKHVKKGNELMKADDLKGAQKELDKAIALTPGTPAVNKLANDLKALEPANNQVDLFEEAQKADAQNSPVIADESGEEIKTESKIHNPLLDLPESPNELEVENNRIIQSQPMRDEEIEALQEEMNQKFNINQQSNNQNFSI